MKPPDSKACARIAKRLREFCAGKQELWLLDEQWPTVLEALEFCAREPDGFVSCVKDETGLWMPTHIFMVPNRDMLKHPSRTHESPFACYRIDETENEW